MSAEANETLSKIMRNVALTAGAVALAFGVVEVATDAVPAKEFVPIQVALIGTAIESASFSQSTGRWAAADRRAQTGQQG